MQGFIFKLDEDGTVSVTGYKGDEVSPVIPGEYCGRAVTVLYDGLFSGHAEICSLTIPDTVTDMGEFLFRDCTGLKSLTLPAGVRFLWGHTFAYSSLEEIILSDSLASIPAYAFKNCKALRRIVCGKGLKNIRAHAFSGCGELSLECAGDVIISPDAYI